MPRWSGSEIRVPCRARIRRRRPCPPDRRPPSGCRAGGSSSRSTACRPTRLVDVAGTWLAVVFAPEDVRLASGPASGRRLFLDRTLALSDPAYLAALGRYRAALAQRNAALRQGRPDLAAAFDAAAGRRRGLGGGRDGWPGSGAAAERFAAGLHGAGRALGRRRRWTTQGASGAGRRCRVARPAGAQAAPRDRGPADDDGRPAPRRPAAAARVDGRSGTSAPPGSSGARRSRSSCWSWRRSKRPRGSRRPCCWTMSSPSWTSDRQARLAARLFGDRAAQVFITAPRADELPAGLALPVWQVVRGAVRRSGERPDARQSKGLRKRRMTRSEGPVRPDPAGRRAAGATSSARDWRKRIGQAGVLEEWADLVGPQIAQVTAPESVSPDGVLAGPGGHRGLGHRAVPDDARRSWPASTPAGAGGSRRSAGWPAGWAR